GNLLQDDLAAGPGTTVGLDLPTHWRACYWALAVWGVGAGVVIGGDALDADVLVTADPERARAHAGDAVLVSLPALARSHPGSADAGGAIDEARELSTHGDQFVALADPEAADLALSDRGHDTAYDSLVRMEHGWGDAPRVALNGSLGGVLQQALSAWAGRGSVVLSRGVAQNEARRLASEGVTITPV
ncbi:MAG: TIGR03089 family protein, partial [Terracoccus sp.]